MYQADSEILYPMRVTPMLRDVRGPVWRQLVDSVCTSHDDSLCSLAFSLLIIRLTSCLSCHTYSYRAMRGCTSCAIQAVRRFNGTDEDLLALYEESLDEIRAHLQRAASIERKGQLLIQSHD